MLSKAARVRAVYRELKRVFGPEKSSVELLKHAAKLVDYAVRVDEVDGEFLRSSDPKSVYPRLDIVLSDGGWQVLSREALWLRDLLEEYETFIPRCESRKAYLEMERSLYPINKVMLGEGWIKSDEE